MFAAVAVAVAVVLLLLWLWLLLLLGQLQFDWAGGHPIPECFRGVGGGAVRWDGGTKRSNQITSKRGC